MKKLTVAAALIAVLALLMSFSALAANRTQQEAVDWANARLSEKWAVDYDGYNGCQDTDLIQYYCDWLGVYRITGYAYSYLNAILPSGWTRSYVPQPGDIVVWDANTGMGPYGHVGIVTQIIGTNIRYVATNDGATQCTSHQVSRYDCSTYIHPVFQTNGTLDVNWRVDGSNVDGSQNAGTVDVYINGSLRSNDCDDFYDTVPYGATYEIKDIRAKSGYTYKGVVSGSLSGTVNGPVSVRLSFEKSSSSKSGNTVIITGSNVPVRSYASTDAKRLGTLGNNTAWTYKGSTIADYRGVNWYSIDFYGQTGWVSSKLSTLKDDPSSYSYGDTITIVNGNTNIRQTPSLDGKILGVARKGTTWTYMGASSVDSRGIAWYKISYKSSDAWISSKYAEISTGSEGGKTGAYTVTESAYLVNNTPKVDGEKAFDGQSDTCWCVSENYNSFGQWVQIDYASVRSFSGFTIINGYDKVRGKNDYWQLNSRVSTLAVYCDGSYVGLYTLSDTRSPQTISFGWPQSGSSFRFVIRGVYGGSKYSDVCISEITLY